MKDFSCSSCGTVAADGVRVSVGEVDGKAMVEVATESATRLVRLPDLAAMLKPEIPKAIKTEKPRGS